MLAKLAGFKLKPDKSVSDLDSVAGFEQRVGFFSVIDGFEIYFGCNQQTFGIFSTNDNFSSGRFPQAARGENRLG